jgi:hypothetical protein
MGGLVGRRDGVLQIQGHGDLRQLVAGCFFLGSENGGGALLVWSRARMNVVVLNG